MDVSKFQIGGGKIWVDNGSGERAIGYTLDDIQINYEPVYRDRKTSQTGETPVDKVLVGERASIEFSILEIINENLMLAIPNMTVFTDTGETLGLGSAPYSSLYDKVVKVRFHPINRLATGSEDDETFLDDDWTFWKCVNAESVAIAFKSGESEDRAYKVKMDVFPDTSKASMRLGIKGDPANTTLDVTAPALDDEAAKGVAVLVGVTRTRIEAGSALANAATPTNILITMNEALDSGSALNKANYAYVDEAAPDTLIAITTVAIDATFKIITLTVPAQTAEHTYRLVFNGLKDLAGNQQTTAISRRFTIAAA